MEDLNIVHLIEGNPITKLTGNYNSKLLQKIQTYFGDYEKQLFVSSFYCYLNYNSNTDYVVNLDTIWKWIGFNQKVKAKILLEKHFIIDKDYKKLLSQLGKQDLEEKKHGGYNKEIFMLSIKTFKLFCIKAGTSKANEIHEYFVKLEEILNEVLEEESNELKLQIEYQKKQLQEKEEELQEKEEELQETLKLKGCENIPTIYIYNIDTTKVKPELKIGITNNVLARIKPYKQICKHGKIEFTIPVKHINIKILETYIHTLLSSSRVKDEVFSIDIEEAKFIILNVVELLNITQIKNDYERIVKLQQLYEKKESTNKLSTTEISTQTDFDENVIQSTPLLFYDNELTTKFNNFIDNHCIINNDVEISSKDIIGQYRLLSRDPKKEIFHALKHYLDTRFKPCRLNNQIENQLVHGYKGVTLKPIEYKKKLELSNEQTFLFQVCKFSPRGTVLFSTLSDEYQRWKKSINLQINKENDDIELKKYLKKCDYVLCTTVWTTKGNGQGYYGIIIKNDEYTYKKTSSTGKRVEKIDLASGEIIGKWETIAKAAHNENIAASKMSISIKNKKIFNNEYYYNIITN